MWKKLENFMDFIFFEKISSIALAHSHCNASCCRCIGEKETHRKLSIHLSLSLILLVQSPSHLCVVFFSCWDRFRILELKCGYHLTAQIWQTNRQNSNVIPLTWIYLKMTGFEESKNINLVLDSNPIREYLYFGAGSTFFHYFFFPCMKVTE